MRQFFLDNNRDNKTRCFLLLISENVLLQKSCFQLLLLTHWYFTR